MVCSTCSAEAFVVEICSVYLLGAILNAVLSLSSGSGYLASFVLSSQVPFPAVQWMSEEMPACTVSVKMGG